MSGRFAVSVKNANSSAIAKPKS